MANLTTSSLAIKLVLLLAIALVCNIVGSAVVMGVMYLNGTGGLTAVIDQVQEADVPRWAIGLIHLTTFSISSVFYYHYIYREDNRSFTRYLGMHSPLDISLIPLLLGMLALLYPILMASVQLTELLPINEWMQATDESQIEQLLGLLQMDNFWQYLAILTIVAIIPAIGEELLFRGLLQRILQQHIANPHVAIFIASLIFSAIHLQATGLLPKLLIGLLLGYVYYWTGNLFYSILLHFINNGLSVTALYLSGAESTEVSGHSTTPEWSVLIGTSIVCAVLLYFLVLYTTKQIRSNERNP